MLRGFTDSEGLEWRVWAVVPTKGEGVISNRASRAHSSLDGTAFALGWLCFECGAEKRRLAPIPRGWEKCDATALEELCARAAAVRVRQKRIS